MAQVRKAKSKFSNEMGAFFNENGESKVQTTKFRKSKPVFNFDKLMSRPLNAKMFKKIRRFDHRSGLGKDPSQPVKFKDKFGNKKFVKQKQKWLKKMFVKNLTTKHRSCNKLQKKFNLMKIQQSVEKFKDAYHSRIFGNRESIFDFLMLKRL